MALGSIVYRGARSNSETLPATFQRADVRLLPGRYAFSACRVLRSVEGVTGVARVPCRRQSRAVPQLGLSGIHDGHHPVPGRDQLFFHVVLVGDGTRVDYGLVQWGVTSGCTSLTLQAGLFGLDWTEPAAVNQ